MSFETSSDKNNSINRYMQMSIHNIEHSTRYTHTYPFVRTLPPQNLNSMHHGQVSNTREPYLRDRLAHY